MIGSNTITGIVIGLILTVFLGLIFYYAYDKLLIEHWLPQTVISGVIIILFMACFGIVGDNDAKMEKSIENTITTNYNNVYIYHNDKTDKSFISDTSKYTFDYDKKTDTLIVFNNSSDVDAVFIDGVKQDIDQ